MVFFQYFYNTMQSFFFCLIYIAKYTLFCIKKKNLLQMLSRVASRMIILNVDGSIPLQQNKPYALIEDFIPKTSVPYACLYAN